MIMVPFPFLILDIYARALADLLLLGGLILLIGRSALQRRGEGRRWGKGIDIARAGDMIRELLIELRKYGKWRVVEVKTDDTEVYVDLY